MAKPKDPGGWWFGANSLWQQTGLKGAILGRIEGGSSDDDDKDSKGWEFPISDSKVGLDDQTMMMVGAIVVLYLVTK